LFVVSGSPLGISLRQFAGIRAALTEGFPLSDVLDQEGVPQWRWPALERELTVRITADPQAFEAFTADLQTAEDHLSRQVRPIDEDLAAWVGFIEAYRTGGQALLDAHGLRPTDVGRLQRKWQTSLSEDDELRQRAEKLGQRPPPSPTQIEAGSAELTPFPWTPGSAEAEQRRSLEPVGFLARTELAKPAPPSEPLPFAGHRPPPPAKLALEPSPEMGATARAEERPRAAATPFEPEPPAAEPSTAEPAPSHLLSGPALSTPTPSARPLQSPPPSPPKHSPLEPVLGLGTTVEALGRRTGPALPFGGLKEAPTPVASRLEPSPSMGATRAVQPRGEHRLEPSLLKKGGLEPVAELAVTAPAERNASKGHALPFGGAKASPAPIVSSLEPAVDLGMTKASASRADTPLPFARAAADAPVAEAPTSTSWSPEDYGRYCAELDTSERRVVWERWGVHDEAHHQAIAAHFVRQFNARPELRQRFAAALKAAASRTS